jgi:hypothetical protein
MLHLAAVKSINEKHSLHVARLVVTARILLPFGVSEKAASALINPFSPSFSVRSQVVLEHKWLDTRTPWALLTYRQEEYARRIS